MASGSVQGLRDTGEQWRVGAHRRSEGRKSGGIGSEGGEEEEGISGGERKAGQVCRGVRSHRHRRWGESEHVGEKRGDLSYHGALRGRGQDKRGLDWT